MNKFIVTTDNKLKFGDVRMHRDLLGPWEDCNGGGMYEFDYANNRMNLFGASYDFGRVKWSWVEELHVPVSLEGMDIYYEGLPINDFCPITYTQED